MRALELLTLASPSLYDWLSAWVAHGDGGLRSDWTRLRHLTRRRLLLASFCHRLQHGAPRRFDPSEGDGTIAASAEAGFLVTFDCTGRLTSTRVA